MRSIPKPKPDEYPAYSHIYMDLMADDGRVLEHFWNNFLAIKSLVKPLSEEQLLFRYAKDKWTIKEILVHLIDDERIYTYRALRFARHCPALIKITIRAIQPPMNGVSIVFWKNMKPCERPLLAFTSTFLKRH